MIKSDNKSQPKTKDGKDKNTSKNLLNQIRQVTNYLYPEKEVTKKVYKNKMNSIKL